MTPQDFVDLLDRTIRELEYPPLHPTITRDEIIQLLKDSRDIINGEYELEDTHADIREMCHKISSLLSDIDYATSKIEDLLYP